jgi:type IV pilus assembly protein PilV
MTVKNQNGVGMIEVLITLLVLSIGLLGLAGLQASSLRNNQSAYMRTQAVILAYDILDRMRANQMGVEAGSYNDIDTADLPSQPGCIATGCSFAQLADYDIVAWGTDLNNALSSALGRVETNGDGTFTVTIMWDDARNGASGTGCDPDDADDRQCFFVTSQIP